MTECDWLDAIAEATALGARGIHTSDDYNRACDHIFELLNESVLLLRIRSPRTAFLAITALEEIAKVHVGMFRPGEAAPRRSDPLFSHGAKHKLAAAPTVAMGSRLHRALGTERVLELVEEARSGKLIRLREAALYLEMTVECLRMPNEAVPFERTRDLLLFAIEAFDDALVGYTEYSHELGRKTDVLFVEVAAV